ncbi:MAG: amino acid ABC transporter permease [Deltaproteobacteria bacterium]|jgi:polar amino acid transport system permease protein|nr:amino acid ABC transporter permease [Deltaproteobacteria bacterium]
MDTWEFYRHILIPAVNKGLIISIQLILPSAALGVILGLLVGAGRAVGPGWLAKILNAYVSVFRGTPLVVQLVMWFYGLPGLALKLEAVLKPCGFPPVWEWLLLSPYAAAVLGFTLCSAAYQSEYIRGAVLSIKKGQFLAARSLGFSNSQAFWAITAPVAVRRALPGCGNEIIYLIKYSSLALVVTVSEITGQARNVASLYFRHLECYLLAALYYLAMVTVATLILHWLEKKLAVPGPEGLNRD